MRATLLENTLELQAQANRLMHASPIHRGVAEALRDRTRELSMMLRDLQPTPDERGTLDLFFPIPSTNGQRPKRAFLHLPD